MSCDWYCVIEADSEVVVAKHMPIEVALTLVKALMMDYHCEPNLGYTIKRERDEQK